MRGYYSPRPKYFQSIIATAEELNRFSPARALKLYGLLNFLENGMFRQVVCGGLREIKDHQYGRTQSLSRAVLTRLSRSWKLSPRDSFGSRTTPGRVLFAASGAAQDAVRTGSEGYLILCAFSPRPREAFAADIPDTLFDWLEPGSQKIAQLEMPMIAHALIKRAGSFRRRPGFWFIDNVASLMHQKRRNEPGENRPVYSHSALRT